MDKKNLHIGITTQEAIEGIEKFLEFLKQEKVIDNEKIVTCSECGHHRSFVEEDGTDDRCVCEHKIAKEKFHLDNCIEYTNEYKGCPYLKKW